jgi:anti-sigma B factor antagonist
MAAPLVFPCPAEITSDSLPAMEADVERLLGPEGTRLVLDLQRTTFVGSAGLGLLVRLGKRLHDRGGGLALAAARPPVQRLLRVVGLGQLLPLFPEVEEAAAHLGPPEAPR